MSRYFYPAVRMHFLGECAVGPLDNVVWRIPRHSSTTSVQLGQRFDQSNQNAFQTIGGRNHHKKSIGEVIAEIQACPDTLRATICIRFLVLGVWVRGRMIFHFTVPKVYSTSGQSPRARQPGVKETTQVIPLSLPCFRCLGRVFATHAKPIQELFSRKPCTEFA